MSHVIGTPGAPCPGPRRFPSGVRVVIPPAVPYPLGHPVRTVNGVLPDEHGDIRVADATATERGLMSAEDKAKLDGVEVGAEVNAVATVKVDGAALVPDEGRAVDIDLTGKADKATTLAGYGITDARIANGTITLGSNSITPLTQHQSLAAYVNGGSYDSNAKKILLKHDSTTVAEIDATAFVKDGMVSSVAISSGKLVITFNTDAGKEPVEIPLTDIFNPANYYDKTAANTLLSGKADKVANATSGNLAALDASGNLTDSGKAAGDFLPKTGGTVNGDLEVAYTNAGFTVKDASGNYLRIQHGTGAGDFWYVDYSVANVGSGSLRLPYDNIIPADVLSLAGYFNGSTTYTHNSLCVDLEYGRLYRCVNPNGHTGAWVAADFAVATVEDVLAALRTALAGKQDALSAAQLASIAAVPNKADASALRYDLASETVIDTASQETVGGETVNYGEATLADRTGNRVSITAALDELRVTFPPAVSGKLRDFGLRVEVGTGSADLTAPALVPVAPTGETIKLENNAKQIPALADGTATAKGVTLIYFSESAPGVFFAKGEQVEEVA